MSKKKISNFDFIERCNMLTRVIATTAEKTFKLQKVCPFCGSSDEFYLVDVHVRLLSITLRYCCAECQTVTLIHINGDEITTESMTYEEEQRRVGGYNNEK